MKHRLTLHVLVYADLNIYDSLKEKFSQSILYTRGEEEIRIFCIHIWT
jgi:hypothetical protein